MEQGSLVVCYPQSQEVVSPSCIASGVWEKGSVLWPPSSSSPLEDVQVWRLHVGCVSGRWVEVTTRKREGLKNSHAVTPGAGGHGIPGAMLAELR